MRILLADSHPEVVSALHFLLEQEPGLEVVAEADEAGALLDRAEELRPDLVLLEWELPGIGPMASRPRTRRALFTALRRTCPEVAVVAMSGRPEVRRNVLAAGADGFVSKGDPPEHLLGALRGFLQRRNGVQV